MWLTEHRLERPRELRAAIKGERTLGSQSRHEPNIRIPVHNANIKKRMRPLIAENKSRNNIIYIPIKEKKKGGMNGDRWYYGRGCGRSQVENAPQSLTTSVRTRTYGIGVTSTLTAGQGRSCTRTEKDKCHAQRRRCWQRPSVGGVTRRCRTVRGILVDGSVSGMLSNREITLMVAQA